MVLDLGPLAYVLPLAALSLMGLVALCVPLGTRIAAHIGAIDDPLRDARRVHVRTTPRSGGLMLAPLFLLACAFMGNGWLSDPWFLSGGAVLLFIGAWDDARDVRPLIKLGAQIGAVLALVLGTGLGPASYPIPFTDSAITAKPVVMTISLILGVGMINAVNLIDGLDGLAGGFAATVALGLAALGWSTHQLPVLVGGSLLAAACFGFLAHNSYPARVFMGDAGSLVLGFSLTALTFGAVTPNPGATIPVGGILVPLLMLSLAWADCLWVMIMRMIRGQHPFSADKSHIHHYVLRTGLRHEFTSLLLVAIAGITVVLALMLVHRPPTEIFLVIGILVMGVLGGLRVFQRTSVYRMLMVGNRRYQRSRSREFLDCDQRRRKRICYTLRICAGLAAGSLIVGGLGLAFVLPKGTTPVLIGLWIAAIAAVYTICLFTLRHARHPLMWALFLAASAGPAYVLYESITALPQAWEWTVYGTAIALAGAALALVHQHRLRAAIIPSMPEAIALISGLGAVLCSCAGALPPKAASVAGLALCTHICTRALVASLGRSSLRLAEGLLQENDSKTGKHRQVEISTAARTKTTITQSA